MMNSRAVQHNTAELVKDLLVYYKAVLPMFDVDVVIDQENLEVGHVRLWIGDQLFAKLTVETYAVTAFGIN